MDLHWDEKQRLIEAAEKFANAVDRIATTFEKAYQKEFEEE